jgi:hypothetical protein
MNFNGKKERCKEMKLTSRYWGVFVKSATDQLGKEGIHFLWWVHKERI